MDWIKSDLSFFRNTTYKKVSIVHFDCVESPICPGEVFSSDDVESLEKCQDLLGSVLWLDAVALFLPFLETEFQRRKCSSVLCLGEGTGAIGCALSSLGPNLFSNIYITDLPDLLPLLRVNAKLAGPRVEALSLDWTQPLPSRLTSACDVVIGCEVLYGNRFVWKGLMEAIASSVSSEAAVVYLCVTLRNKRHDLEDFRTEFLSKHFNQIDEIKLSENVCVLKATKSNRP